MSEFDLAPIKTAIESYILLGRSGLLPALHAAQKVYGWLPEDIAAEVARSLRVPLADVHGVIEFSACSCSDCFAGRPGAYENH